MELVHLFTNLKATKLLFFVFRFQQHALFFLFILFFLWMSIPISNDTALLSIQWSPDKSSVFGSSAVDGLLNIWDYDRVCTLSQIHIKTFLLTFKFIIVIYIYIYMCDVYIRSARSLSEHPKPLLGYSSSMLVTGSQDLILVLLFAFPVYTL